MLLLVLIFSFLTVEVAKSSIGVFTTLVMAIVVIVGADFTAGTSLTTQLFVCVQRMALDLNQVWLFY